MTADSDAYEALMAERNRLARECADLRDQRDDMAREVAAIKDHVSIIDDDRERLCEALFQATGRDWATEEARRWSS